MTVKKRRRKRRNQRNEARRRYDAKPTPAHHFVVRLPRVVIDPSRKWYVARTVPRAERKIAAEFAGLDVQPYWPAVIETVTRHGRQRRWERGLLPGYLFAGLPVAMDAFSWLAAWNYAQIEKTRQRPIVGVYGPIRVGELQAFADHVAADDNPLTDVAILQHGQEVIVEAGAFQWFRAIVDEIREGGRVLTEVNVFGRMTPVEFDIAQLRIA